MLSRSSGPALKAMIIRNIGRSVIRRAILLMGIMLPGFLLNYMLIFGASRILSLDVFGVFYTAISIINVLFAPAVIVGHYFARAITERMTLGGEASAVALFRGIVRLVSTWGGAATVALTVIFLLSAQLLGAEAIFLVVAIGVALYSSYLVEASRSGFHGLQRFATLGVAGLVWMASRFVFGLAGIALAKTAWAGIAGIALAGFTTFAVFYRLLVRGRDANFEQPTVDRNHARRLPLFLASSGLYALISYMDVILAYLLLDGDGLGVYSASSVLPKAIILLAAPIIQVLFSVMVQDATTSSLQGFNFAKGFGLTLAFSTVCAAGLMLLDGIFCGQQLGIRSCDSGLLSPLAVSAIPLCLLRVLVYYQLAKGRDWHPLLLILPSGLFAGIALAEPATSADLAISYVIFGGMTLAVYAVACVDRSVLKRVIPGRMARWETWTR